MIGDVRRILAEHGKLDVDPWQLSPEEDLFAAGLTSHSAVNVMLAIEDGFDIEFPDRLINRSVFESITVIAAALSELTSEDAAAPSAASRTT